MKNLFLALILMGCTKQTIKPVSETKSEPLKQYSYSVIPATEGDTGLELIIKINGKEIEHQKAPNIDLVFLGQITQGDKLEVYFNPGNYKEGGQKGNGTEITVTSGNYAQYHTVGPITFNQVIK